MVYQAKDYTELLGLKGFSKELLKNHFTLYEGYVKNANNLLNFLNGMFEKGQMAGPEFTELKRRLPFEMNGIKLHEYYFENMSRDSSGLPDKENAFHVKVAEDFGSYKKWESSFRAVALTRGIGWVVTIYDPSVSSVFNTWVDEHHLGHVAGTTPLLVCDLWEHAMLLDYGSNREEYLDAFLKVVDWGTVAHRVDKAFDLQGMYQVEK